MDQKYILVIIWMARCIQFGNNWLLADTCYDERYGAYIVFSDGQLDAVGDDGAGGPIRPLVKLSSEATGTVGTTIEIDK